MIERFHAAGSVGAEGVTAAGSERVTNSQLLKENLIAAGETKPANHDAHHKIPNEALRDHGLGQETLGRGIYDPDRAENGIFLPESQAAKEATNSELPVHCGGHPQYNQLALTEANSIEAKLIDRYGSLEAVPDAALKAAMGDWEKRMDEHVRNPKNWTDDGRLK